MSPTQARIQRERQTAARLNGIVVNILLKSCRSPDGGTLNCECKDARTSELGYSSKVIPLFPSICRSCQSFVTAKPNCVTNNSNTRNGIARNERRKLALRKTMTCTKQENKDPGDYSL